jgi:hypothetical protein
MCYLEEILSTKPRFNSIPSGFLSCRFLSFTIFQKYLYQKDERALPGNLQKLRIKEKSFLPPLNVVPLTTSHDFLFSFFLYLLYLKG